jgi:hypothetical protein
MKKTILTIFYILIITGLLMSQTKWTDIIYHYQTGSIPPPHFYRYEFTVNSGGFGTLVYYPDYSDVESWVYSIKIPDSEIKQLDEAVTKSRILDETVPALADSLRPIGGSIENVTVFLQQDPNLDQVPKRIITPDFPQKKYKERLEQLYISIKNLIPQSTWDEIKARKEEFIKNYK